MKETPIPFNTQMVQAILDGRKTQTRRTQGLNKINQDTDKYYFQSLVHHAYGHFTFVEKGNYTPKPEDIIVVKCPYGKPGDLLWVKETWRVDGHTTKHYMYSADTPFFSGGIKWKPSIHMPKAAARIWLKIEEIRVERLQDISEEDAKAEGTPESYCVHTPYNEYWAYGFNCLWNEINGIESWDRNPWVWAITFKVISTIGKPKIVNRKS